MTSKRIEDEPDYDPKTEFTCVDCGTWVHIFTGVPEYRLCCSCLFTPGWFRNEKLRAIFDREHTGEPYTP